jgi:hypothetical protein
MAAVPTGIKYKATFKAYGDPNYVKSKEYVIVIHDNSSFTISLEDGTGKRYHGSLKNFFAHWDKVSELTE